MVRTQIYLPEGAHRRLKGLARKRRLSMAHLVREYVEGGMNKDNPQNTVSQTVMQKLVELRITGGPKDLSKNLDTYLYG